MSKQTYTHPPPAPFRSACVTPKPTGRQDSRGPAPATPLVFVALCLLLTACMTTPRGSTDLREYTLDGPGLATRQVVGKPQPPIGTAVHTGHITVTINGAEEKLETLTVTPLVRGPLPLALISHGVPLKRSHARLNSLRMLWPIAESFAHRGYRAVVFARRGYGSSTGHMVDKPSGRCVFRPTRAYVDVAQASADDYAAVLEALASRPDVDGSRIVAVGQSAAGLAVLALAARQPTGLIGVINFAGGHGGTGARQICSGRALRGAFAAFGRGARVPALWLYSTADRFFWPSLVRRNFEAYIAGDASARLEMVGPLWFTNDGHDLIELGGRELWQPRISAFLRDIHAPGWPLNPASATVPRPPPPEHLNRTGRQAWTAYNGRAGHKAFAAGNGGGWGWTARQPSRREAEEAAMATCRKHAEDCRLVSVDGDSGAATR